MLQGRLIPGSQVDSLPFIEVSAMPLQLSQSPYQTQLCRAYVLILACRKLFLSASRISSSGVHDVVAESMSGTVRSGAAI